MRLDLGLRCFGGMSPCLPDRRDAPLELLSPGGRPWGLFAGLLWLKIGTMRIWEIVEAVEAPAVP